MVVFPRNVMTHVMPSQARLLGASARHGCRVGPSRALTIRSRCLGVCRRLTQRSELLLPRLSEKQTTAVRTLDAKIRGMKRDTAVCSISSRHALTSTSFVSVTGSNLVDDSVMNAFMHLLDSDRLPHLEKTPFKVHAMKTHWYTKLALGGYADVQRWTSAKNCQHKDSCVTVPSLAPTSSLYQSTSRITGRAGLLT
jgi:hypothetical protein